MGITHIRRTAAFNLSFHWFAIGIIIPVMTLFLIEKGFTLFQVGIAFAVYSGTTVVLELPTGGLADAIGRKRVYIISLTLQFTGSLLIIFLTNTYAVMCCFIFQGAARSLSSGTMDAHFIDQFMKYDPEINLQKEMARLGVFIPLALGAGSLLGGFIPMYMSSIPNLSSSPNIYTGNYLLHSFTILIQGFMTIILVREYRKEAVGAGVIVGFRQVPAILKTSTRFGLTHGAVLLILLAGFCWGLSLSGLEQLWQPQVRSIIPDTTGSWIFGVLTFGYFAAAGIGNLAATPICRIFKDNYPVVLFLGRSLMGLFYLLLAFQTSIIPFSSLYIILFMCNGIQGSPESALFNREIPSEKRSTMLSLSSLFLQAGGIIGSLLLGFLAERYTIPTAWITSAIIMLLSSLLYLGIPAALRKQREKEGITQSGWQKQMPEIFDKRRTWE